uniref:Reverse transcriptase domain-containing protein n=1 Tax=Steinernema glaseri TaxID=37863 RepID=A0A1I8A7Q3_9BILA
MLICRDTENTEYNRPTSLDSIGQADVLLEGAFGAILNKNRRYSELKNIMKIFSGFVKALCTLTAPTDNLEHYLFLKSLHRLTSEKPRNKGLPLLSVIVDLLFQIVVKKVINDVKRKGSLGCISEAERCSSTIEPATIKNHRYKKIYPVKLASTVPYL